MPVRSFATGVALTILMLSGSATRAAECDCTDLAELQIELRNAMRLQATFRGRVAALRALGSDASRDAFQRFAQGEAQQGLEPRSSGGESHVEYVGYGEGVAVENLDIHPGQTRQERQAQLCAMRASSAAALEESVRTARCDGIGRAIRAHESLHVNMCSTIGYRAYIGMHGADRAAEEAEAYGVQIGILRAEIIRVLERLNPRVEATTSVRVVAPRNPLYAAIVVAVQAEVLMTRVAVLDPNTPRVRFDGQGRQVTNARIEGNCRITGGMPMTFPVTGGIETDGLVARITYSLDSISPAVSMQCQVPGGGRGSGMSMPAPMTGGLPDAITLPLRNGAEEVTDMATTPAAAMLAQAGARLTGEGRFRLVLNCPAR